MFKKLLSKLYPPKIELVSWQRLPDGDYEVKLSNGGTYRGNIAWYSYPDGEFVHWTTFGHQVDDLLERFEKLLVWGLIADKEIK